LNTEVSITSLSCSAYKAIFILVYLKFTIRKKSSNIKTKDANNNGGKLSAEENPIRIKFAAGKFMAFFKVRDFPLRIG